MGRSYTAFKGLGEQLARNLDLLIEKGAAHTNNLEQP